MLIKTLSGQAELTGDALVIRTKKSERVLPFNTIVSIEYVPPKNFLAAGYVRPLLFEDPTRAAYPNLDGNYFSPASDSKEARAAGPLFAQALIERVTAATPKVVHSNFANVASDIAKLRKTAKVALREEAKAERKTSEELQAKELRHAKYEEARVKREAEEAAFSAQYPALPGQIEEALASATRHAANGNVDYEHASTLGAIQLAKATAGRKGVDYAEREIGRLRAQKKLLIGATRLGIVEPEGRFNATGRTNSLGGLLSGGGVRIEVYNDRVIQGGTSKSIDPHTRATVYIDGEQQLVSTNPFNSRKQNTDDRRRAEFQVAGSGWSLRVPVNPDRLQGPRQLANQINAAASQLASQRPVAVIPHESVMKREAPALPVTSPPPASVIEQLEKLQALLRSGAIDDQEFKALKVSLLSAVN